MSHLTHSRSHSESREAVCIVCGNKGSEKISGALIELVKKYVLEEYDLNDDRLPTALCKTHKTILYEHQSGNCKRQLHVQNFQKYAGYTTRKSCEQGKCEICNAARRKFSSMGPVPLKPKRGRPAVKGEPSSSKHETPTAHKLCITCFSPIGRGLPHTCSRQAKINNTLAMLSPKSKEQICSSVLKVKAAQSTPSKRRRIVSLATKGRALHVAFNATEDTTHSQLTVGKFCELQINNNLSSNQVKAVASMIRQELGQKIIETNLREKLSEKGKLLEPYFEQYELCFFEKAASNKLLAVTRPAIMTRDTKSLIRFVLQHRCYNPETTLIKLGLDSGQGFFKICLNLVNLDSPEKKKPKAADCGVKGLLILCIVPEISELYVNVETCLQELDLQDIDYVMATDLKLANVVAGIQSHGSQHPCCYCETTSGVWEHTDLRTLGSIKDNYNKWQQSGGKLSESKNYKNCVHPPLLNGKESDRVIDLIPPPELHLFMGPFNHMYKELKKIWNDVDKWPGQLNVKAVCYHGGENFIGGDCSKLLKNVDHLAQMCPITVLPYVTAFRKFRTVVDSCYGAELSPSLNEDIASFEDAYKQLGISITPKVHIVFHHVPHFCQEAGVGLARFSEQASESVHSIFKAFWRKRKINCISNPNYSKALFDTIVEFNSKHI